MWIFWLWVQNWSKFGIIRLHHIHLHLFLVRASAWLNTRSRAPVCLPVPDDLKNEDDLKIEDDLKNEDNLKSEEDLKKLTILVFRHAAIFFVKFAFLLVQDFLKITLNLIPFN